MFTKLSVALIGALAVAAQAGPHYGQQHGHQKHHKIKTSSAYANQTSTLPSVSSSLGNSPAQASSAPLETFPTIEATGSSSVPLGTGSSVAPTIPLTTGGSAAPAIPLTTGVSSTGGNSPVQTGGDHTLTYTLGSGSSTTVVTTTIKQTSTETNVNTVYATEGSEAGVTGGSEGGSEPTTTITSTSTSTEYRTIVPISSGVGNSPVGAGGASGSGSSPVGASGSGKCAAQATVTVTGSPVTVTVTAGSSPSSPASSGSDQSPISSSGPYPVSSKKTKIKCPTASTGFITKPYPSFTSAPSASITFQPASTGEAAGGYM
ncbi:MAG: hypothetical protein L6R39_004536 [Caloplaca ligustica]|nr:MAG: hypothetical protein L6R39_004536 [Caloplaca ligustica]